MKHIQHARCCTSQFSIHFPTHQRSSSHSPPYHLRPKAFLNTPNSILPTYPTTSTSTPLLPSPLIPPSTPPISTPPQQQITILITSPQVQSGKSKHPSSRRCSSGLSAKRNPLLTIAPTFLFSAGRGCARYLVPWRHLFAFGGFVRVRVRVRGTRREV
ncbi:hypothetical protein N431DRAFT_164053 [Stipitochalara longipes BDJ]|nr:hypothetical protein N431DRAFT_164053 [Stipitochalara longipes BDJ]